MTDIDIQTNGHQKGRAVPDLPTFTFPTSGITVRVRKIGPFVMDAIGQQLKKERPAPQPPMAPGVEGKPEPNEADPDYERELREYQDWLTTAAAERFIKLMIRRTEVEVDPDAVQQARDDMEAIGVDLSGEDDHAVYVQHVCIASEADLSAFQSFVLSRNQPTPEAVQAHIDSFRSDVQGS